MRGFTLLEILIAMVILAIVMVTVYAAFTSNVEAIHRARQQTQIFQMARIALDRMTKDLESAYIAPYQSNEKRRLGMIGTNQEIKGKPADRLDFTTLSHLTPHENALRTDLCEVGYRLEEDPEQGGFILYRRDDGSLDDDLASGGVSHELARGVVGFNILYQDAQGKEFDDWRAAEGTPATELPSLILVRLLIKDRQGREELFTIGVHPVLAGRQVEE
jgi:type II secretion system protein J